jgi:cytochrome c-type biogenesis protein CcmH/NrfG
LRRRLQDQPNDANLSYLLGEAFLRAGAHEGDPAFAEAQTYLEKAVRLDPKLVEPHVSLGTIYLRQERFQDAVDQLEQARHLDPKAKSAYSHLAIAYRRLGQQDKSKEVLVELKNINDRERTGSRQPMKSEENAPTLPSDSRSNRPRTD